MALPLVSTGLSSRRFPVTTANQGAPVTELRYWLRGLKAYVDWFGGVHDDECPQDDTCDCSGKPANDGINGAINYFEDLLTAQSSAVPASAQTAEALSLAKRAINTWGVFARKGKEQDAIAQLHAEHAKLTAA